MLKAKLYDGANYVQCRDAQNILNEYSTILQWQRLNGQASLLDIGTGSGDVLMDFVYPNMPQNFKSIIGSDVSPGMVRHCQETYSRVENVDFKIFDMETEVLPREFVNEFDRVTSFYCLHWAVDFSHVIKNIYDVLRRHGDCMLVFLAEHSFFHAFKTLSFNSKWTPFLMDIDDFIPVFQYSKNPKTEFIEILKNTGFLEYSVEVRNEVMVYEGLDTMRKNLRAVIPFYDRIPPRMRAEFIDEVIGTTDELNLSESNFNDQSFTYPYRLVVAYARK